MIGKAITERNTPIDPRQKPGMPPADDQIRQNTRLMPSASSISAAENGRTKHRVRLFWVTRIADLARGINQFGANQIQPLSVKILAIALPRLFL